MVKKYRDAIVVQKAGRLLSFWLHYSSSHFCQQYRHYPPACGTDFAGYSYFTDSCPGSTAYSAGQLLFSDSVINLLGDNGLLDPSTPEKSLFYPGLIGQQMWNDPLTGVAAPADKKKFNCRYVIESPAGSPVDCAVPATWKQIQKYYLQCALEKRLEASANANDGGKDYLGDLYEVYEPSPWISCLYFNG